VKISIVIVSYQVKHFLDLCLRSVLRATADIDAEIWVVDNASQDGTVAHVREHYPTVKLIANEGNPGFSTANNQAITQCTGDYILILNPDTVLAEDTLHSCISFMESHANAGAIGVRMVDGTGVFLPESKRALPTPLVAFYKIFGLSSLFPKSKLFGKYHLGYLPQTENHPVDVLSGAYMFFRKEVLDKIGLFDETFFMYGEDIDLSYRVTLGGYQNYYLADTSIIHYKGESTKKGSLNYVRVFYQAMVIFYQKHFGAKYARAFGILVQVAVILRAMMAVAARVLASAYLFMIDALLGFIGIYTLIQYWAASIKNLPQYYPTQFIVLVVPIYIATWIISAYYSGGYEKPFRITTSLRGIAVGTVIIAAIYGFLPETWRFSRSIIMLGAVWMAVVMGCTRILYNLIRHRTINFTQASSTRVVLVGTPTSVQLASQLLVATHSSYEPVASLPIASSSATIDAYAQTMAAQEIVLCDDAMSYRDMIALMIALGAKYQYKIFNESTQSLIGSNSKNTTGELLSTDSSYRLSSSIARNQKRLLDIAVCLLMIPAMPLLLLVNHPTRLISNWLHVLMHRKTWVGYMPTLTLHKLPTLPASVIHPATGIDTGVLDADTMAKVNQLYARDYDTSIDVKLILANIKKLGT
jgi:GT2 family glycosyltransferase